MRTTRPSRPSIPPRSTFTGFRFPPDVIVVAVRWYLRFGLSYRDVEELLIERGVEVDHVTVYRWVQRFTPLLGAGHWDDQGHRRRGHHRSGAGVPDPDGGVAASGMAPHRLLCQQPGRGGSRPAEGAPATDARALAGT